MRVTVQQLASVERQRLIVESDRVIGPSVREVFAIWEVRQVDRSKSFQFNGAVRFDALEQVQRRLVVHPPVIMVADGRYNRNPVIRRRPLEEPRQLSRCI